LLEEVLKESKNKPFLADVFYYLPNTENQPLSPRNANVVRIFLCKNPLTFNELADFFVSKTANCSQFYVETKRSRFCFSVRIFLFAFLVFHEISAKMPI
jgi:hypothetical protein